LEERSELAKSQEEITERLDFYDAVVLMDEEETRRREENIRLRKQRQIERELQLQREEAERIRREEEAERARLAAEEEERRAMELQREHDLEVLQPLVWELERFQNDKADRLNTRFIKLEQRRAAVERRRNARPH
jgi:hypothetical protein